MVARVLFPVALSFALALIVVSSGASAPRGLQDDATPPPEAVDVTEPIADQNGLVTIESPHSVDETMDRLAAAVEGIGLIVVAEIDHTMGVPEAEDALRPTQLLIFGNPVLGADLMRGNQTVGIDLPMKALVWEDEDGQVYLTYNDPAYLAARHGIEDREATIEQMSNALARLAEEATAS